MSPGRVTNSTEVRSEEVIRTGADGAKAGGGDHQRGVETTNKHVWKNSGTYPGIAKKGSPGGKISNTRA